MEKRSRTTLPRKRLQKRIVPWTATGGEAESEEEHDPPPPLIDDENMDSPDVWATQLGFSSVPEMMGEADKLGQEAQARLALQPCGQASDEAMPQERTAAEADAAMEVDRISQPNLQPGDVAGTVAPVGGWTRHEGQWARLDTDHSAGSHRVYKGAGTGALEIRVASLMLQSVNVWTGKESKMHGDKYGLRTRETREQKLTLHAHSS